MSGSPALVIVPAYNEERTVGGVVSAVRSLGYAVCVINDGSRDRTASVALEAGATVLSLPVNLGVGGALRCAFRYAVNSGHEAVVQVDGDGQHDPSEIPALLETMARTGADMVIGSRFLSPDSEYPVRAARQAMMGLLARRAGAAVGSPITDATSGFRAIRMPLLRFFAEEYPVEYLGDTFEALVSAGQRGARVAEHPIRASVRMHGTPSAGLLASGWYLVRALVAAAIVQSRTPDQLLDERGAELHSSGLHGE